MADPCPVCRKDRTLVGYRHLCVPNAVSRNPVTKPSAGFVTSDERRTGRRPIGDRAMTPAERQRRKRQAARALMKQAERGEVSNG